MGKTEEEAGQRATSANLHNTKYPKKDFKKTKHGEKIPVTKKKAKMWLLVPELQNIV